MRNNKVAKITLYAMIIAIIALMTFVPQVGYITIGSSISITTIHIVVIIAAWAFGIGEGVVAGLFFGIFSMIRAMVAPSSPADIDFINPFISVLPRLLFGFIAGGSFYFIRFIKKPSDRFIVATVVTPILTFIHSVLTLSIYYVVTIVILHKYSMGYIALIGGIFTINGLLEIAGSLIIVPPIVYAIAKALPKLSKVRLNNMETFQNLTYYDDITTDFRQKLVSNLKKFVKINSVYDETSIDENNPFGKGVSSSLQFIEKLARKDGFIVNNYDNKIVEILYGEQEKNITILAHADVVPTGNGWEHNPFKVKQKDGVLTGRGVSDDKGPLLASYYALLALKKKGLIGNYQVRLLVGGNEESGSLGVYHYFEELKKKEPTYGFTPDSDFPLIFAEKGIITFSILKEVKFNGVISLSGGEAANSVIDRFHLVLDSIDELCSILNSQGVEYEKVNNNGVIIHGVAAHGSMPEKGVNAALIGLKALSQIAPDKKLSALIDKIDDVYGRGIECDNTSPEMGQNSLNVGIVEYKDGLLKVVINFRYVNTTDEQTVLNAIHQSFKGYEINILNKNSLLWYPLDSKLVTTLLKVYQDETGDIESKPLAIGGGTYAKEAKNIVAFGAQFPNYDTYMHSNQERMKLEHLFKSMSIYAKAIVELGNLIDENEV